MRLSINEFAKTVEGRSLVEEQSVFCLGGMLWQGWKGSPMDVSESQLSIEEMERIVDVDNTMQRQWKIRHDRIEGRFHRKRREYDERRAQLRQRKNEVMRSLQDQKAMGISLSLEDKAELETIDKRMVRLRDLDQETEFDRVLANLDRMKHVDAPQPEPQRLQCGEDGCEAMSPPGHKNPEMWLRGHQMHHKSKKRKKTA